VSGLYWLNVTAHVLAAILWLGGMFFLGVVGAPVLRKVEPPALRMELFSRLGEQFRTVGWIAIAVLLLTGVLNLHFRGLLRWEVLGDAAFWGTRYGRALGWKLAVVTVMIVISALHDFVLGPSASRRTPGTPEAIRARWGAVWLARVNSVVAVLLVIVAVRLARGG
jgi:copper resistance protein D